MTFSIELTNANNSGLFFFLFFGYGDGVYPLFQVHSRIMKGERGPIGGRQTGLSRLSGDLVISTVKGKSSQNEWSL